jgi:hypothetical protein
MADVKFFSVAQVKAHFGVTEIKVVKNPKTDKLFVIVDEDTALKCQQDIDVKGNLSFICSEFDKKGNPIMESACLINVAEGAGLTTLTTL